MKTGNKEMHCPAAAPVKVLFVCLGNICRSPMAEMVFRHMVNEKNLSDFFEINSAGTEEYNALTRAGIHPGTQAVLRQNHIPFTEHIARYFTKNDYEYYDYILVMDHQNKRDVLNIIGKEASDKIFCLMDFTSHPGDVQDPWYTGRFEETYRDVFEGCSGFLKQLMQHTDLKL